MENTKPLPPVEYLRECFDYDPETGVLRWRVRPLEHFLSARVMKTWNIRYAGTEAGWIEKLGYRVVRVDTAMYKTHRIAWAMYYGTTDNCELDHINGKRLANQINNLRVAHRRENNRNARRRSDNTSGYKGVTYYRNNKKWGACIGTGTQRTWLGLHDTPEAAHAAYCAAADRLHGEFANHG
jgi:hypothetical protein